MVDLSDLERDLHARRHALDALPKLDLRLDLMELVGIDERLRDLGARIERVEVA